TVLGEEEWCCGAPIFLGGGYTVGTSLAKHNCEELKKLGVKKIVTTCAGCYRSFKIVYPKILGEDWDIEVVHASELIDDLVDKKKIKLLNTINEKMTLKPTGVNLVQTDKFDLSAIIARTKHIIESIGAKVVIFDSISAFIADFEYEKTARSKFMDFIREITNLDTTLILTSEIREGEDKATLEEYLVDGVIKIRSDMQNQQLVKYISVPKLRSAKPVKKMTLIFLRPP
ncbi:unnamed protein product, partial [marine sediment metagenome]